MEVDNNSVGLAIEWCHLPCAITTISGAIAFLFDPERRKEKKRKPNSKRDDQYFFFGSGLRFFSTSSLLIFLIRFYRQKSERRSILKNKSDQDKYSSGIDEVECCFFLSSLQVKSLETETTWSSSSKTVHLRREE